MFNLFKNINDTINKQYTKMLVEEIKEKFFGTEFLGTGDCISIDEQAMIDNMIRLNGIDPYEAELAVRVYHLIEEKCLKNDFGKAAKELHLAKSVITSAIDTVNRYLVWYAEYTVYVEEKVEEAVQEAEENNEPAPNTEAIEKSYWDGTAIPEVSRPVVIVSINWSIFRSIAGIARMSLKALGKKVWTFFHMKEAKSEEDKDIDAIFDDIDDDVSEDGTPIVEGEIVEPVKKENSTENVAETIEQPKEATSEKVVTESTTATAEATATQVEQPKEVATEEVKPAEVKAEEVKSEETKQEIKKEEVKKAKAEPKNNPEIKAEKVVTESTTATAEATATQVEQPKEATVEEVKETQAVTEEVKPAEEVKSEETKQEELKEEPVIKTETPFTIMVDEASKQNNKWVEEEKAKKASTNNKSKKKNNNRNTNTNPSNPAPSPC
jgi:hypothetical protein